MLAALLTAVAEAVPAVVKAIDAISHNDKKAEVAAKVAADPAAPPAVQQAAVNVATQAIDDKAKHEKAAVAAMANRAPEQAQAQGMSSATMMLIGIVALIMLKGR